MKKNEAQSKYAAAVDRAILDRENSRASAQRARYTTNERAYRLALKKETAVFEEADRVYSEAVRLARATFFPVSPKLDKGAV